MSGKISSHARLAEGIDGAPCGDVCEQNQVMMMATLFKSIEKSLC
jgi:hypothetical protein